MISRPRNQANIFVVDSNPADYLNLMKTPADDNVRMEVFNNARAALRQDPSCPPELWVVNMSLPDMSGTDLLAMLRWRYPGVPIVLVSDDYRAEDEVSARCSGAELYLCKPLQRSWLTSTATHSA